MRITLKQTPLSLLQRKVGSGERPWGAEGQLWGAWGLRLEGCTGGTDTRKPLSPKPATCSAPDSNSGHVLARNSRRRR